MRRIISTPGPEVGGQLLPKLSRTQSELGFLTENAKNETRNEDKSSEEKELSVNHAKHLVIWR